MTSGPETGSEKVHEPAGAGAGDPETGAGDAAHAADRPEASAEVPDAANDPAANGGEGGANGAASNGASDVSGDGAEDRDVEDGGEAGASDEPSPEERLAAAEALAEEHWNGRLRLQAELENQRKRALRDVQNARKFGLEPLLNDLLPTVDSLEMGLQASAAENATVESIREGMELTRNMLAGTLEKHGVAELNPAGEKFDPEFHQAMSMQSVEGAAPNTVVQVLQKGYTLNERLLRPALVMVAK